MSKFEHLKIKEVCLKPSDKEESREEGNLFFIEILKQFYIAGNLTEADEMIDRLDEILYGITAAAYMDSAAMVKFSKLKQGLPS